VAVVKVEILVSNRPYGERLWRLRGLWTLKWAWRPGCQAIGRTFPWPAKAGLSGLQGTKGLFSDVLAPRDVALSTRVETPKLDVRHFLPVRVQLRTSLTAATETCASKNPGNVRDNPRGSYLYGEAISGNRLPSNPVGH